MVLRLDGQDPVPFDIIAISPDYKQWALAYSCSHTWGLNKVEKIWVLTRWDKVYEGSLKQTSSDWKKIELELLKHGKALNIGENEHFCFEFST